MALTEDGLRTWPADRDVRRELVRTVLARWPLAERERLTSLLTQLNGELSDLLTAERDDQPTTMKER